MLSVSGMDPTLTREERDPGSSVAQLCGAFTLLPFVPLISGDWGIWLVVNTGFFAE